MTYHDPKLGDLTYGPEPDSKNEEQLISSHLPLVRKLAWHVHSRMSSAIEIDDLMQIGMVALVEAAHDYEDRGFGFSNYARLRVHGAMIDHLRKISNLSRSAMNFRKKMRLAQGKLIQQLGRDPDEAELANGLGMDAEAFRLAVDQSDILDFKSMDEVYSDQNMWFEDKSKKADELLEKTQQQEQLATAISSLPEREAMILQLYFVEEMNLDEIGKTMDIGAARVCQIKKVALAKLQDLLAHKK